MWCELRWYTLHAGSAIKKTAILGAIQGTFDPRRTSGDFILHRTIIILFCSALYVIGFSGCVDSTENTTSVKATTLKSKKLEPLFYSTIDFYGKLLRTDKGLYRDGYQLHAENADQDRFCSTAAVGVGLVALCIEHELDRDPQAQQKVLATLRAVNGKLPGFQIRRDSTGYFLHFFDSRDGSGDFEISTIDTALMVVGALFCRNTFDDSEIQAEADELWNSIDWEVPLADPRGESLHMIIEDGKPKADSVTLLFNEYFLLAWLIKESQIQKTGHSDIISIKDLPTWKNEGLTLLGTKWKNPQCSFLVQFPFYMSHPGATDSLYLNFVTAQATADQRACSRRVGVAEHWGCGAGVTPREGYKASNYAWNVDNVVSPNIIAGFMPAFPLAQEHLLKLYVDHKVCVVTPVGDLLPRFSVDYPLWCAEHIDAIDQSSMLFGLAAIHPKLGMKFFQEKTRFTFKQQPAGSQ